MSPRSTRRVIRWLALVVGLVLVGLIVLLATRSPSQATSFESPLLGHQAPVTSAATLSGGRVDLSQERGHVVVLNFFASWCPPCQAEQPQLNAFSFDQSKLGDAAVMLGAVFNDADAAAARFAASADVSYPVMVDPAGRVAAAWGVASPPTTFIIDAKGVVVKALVGPLTAAQLDAYVAKYQTVASG